MVNPHSQSRTTDTLCCSVYDSIQHVFLIYGFSSQIEPCATREVVFIDVEFTSFEVICLVY